MILLWGKPGDSPLTRVHAVLTRLGHPFIFLDQQAVLQTTFKLTTVSQPTGYVRVSNQQIDVSDITAVYARPYPNDHLPALKGGGLNDPGWKYALEINDALWSWLDLSTALVVNRPTAMASNSSKPYQTRIISPMDSRYLIH